jgi:hypothetical protein
MNKFEDYTNSISSIKNNQKIGEQPHKSVAYKTKKMSAFKHHEEETEENFKQHHGYNRSASKSHRLMQTTF